MKKKGLVVFVCVFLITGLIAFCGRGGGGGTAPAPQTWLGPANSSGFPDVAGTYALTTSTIKYSCTDGSSGISPAVELNLVVTQSEKISQWLNLGSVFQRE